METIKIIEEGTSSDLEETRKKPRAAERDRDDARDRVELLVSQVDKEEVMVREDRERDKIH